MKRILPVLLLVTGCAGFFAAPTMTIVTKTDKFVPGIHLVTIERPELIFANFMADISVYVKPIYGYTQSAKTGVFNLEFSYYAHNWLFINKVIILLDDQIVEYEPIVEPIRETFNSPLTGNTVIHETVRIAVPESFYQKLPELRVLAFSLRSDDSKVDVDVEPEVISNLTTFYEYVLQLRGGGLFENIW